VILDPSAVPGQVAFGSDLVARIEVAVSLVNALATTTAGGRPIPAPEGVDERRDRAERAFREADALHSPLDANQARGLEELAEQLRLIFVAIQEHRHDDAGGLLNELFARSGAVPHLHRTGTEPLHLHFHLPNAGFVEGWTAGCAVGLAYALGSGHGDRLGVCAGPDCERVFVDLSRNGSRRFCSTACQNRVKAAHYRARQRAGGLTPDSEDPR
jgi:predicted RNA-binding Zn ribbon-like protein